MEVFHGHSNKFKTVEKACNIKYDSSFNYFPVAAPLHHLHRGTFAKLFLWLGFCHSCHTSISKLINFRHYLLIFCNETWRSYHINFPSTSFSQSTSQTFLVIFIFILLEFTIIYQSIYIYHLSIFQSLYIFS